MYNRSRCCLSDSLFQSGESIVIDAANRLNTFNLSALKQMIGREADDDYQITFASFYVDVAKTPFFIAVDYRHESIVLSIRGTISMKDIITDLHAEAEPISLRLTDHDDWFGHKVSSFFINIDIFSFLIIIDVI